MPQYTIHGVVVDFPFKAYPSQLSMMDKIVKGLAKHENALLESPTGSGKSLALLCGSLSWLIAERTRIRNEEEAERVRADQEQASMVLRAVTDPGGLLNKLKQAFNYHDDFQPAAVRAEPTIAEKEKPIELPPKRQSKLPKIYFGTRTHKQIAQIVREFRSVQYDVQMAVLGSRDQYCIHSQVSQSWSKNEECHKLVEKNSCEFFKNTRPVVTSTQLLHVWDIEDLVTIGKKRKGCPFYASRSLAKDAEIIFCPYNYLIDPAIRESMDIRIDGNVFILDEAHNIEDVARDAGSFSVTDDTLKEMLFHFNRVLKGEHLKHRHEHEMLRHVVQRVLGWIEKSQDKAALENNEPKFVWSGAQIIQTFDESGINRGTFHTLEAAADRLIELVRKDEIDPNLTPAQLRALQLQKEREMEGAKVPITTLNIIKGLLRVCGYFLLDETKSAQEDYRMVILKQERKDDNLRRHNDLSSQADSTPWIHTLALWCLNPAITFRATAAKARCIILTSGTLAPMDSFASELGVVFPIRLEANHVIPKTSVWVGSLGYGPANTSLEATYKNVNTFQFQDQIGQVIVQVVKTVPHGVLCFFSSYSIMNKMTKRWEDTGCFHQIRAFKSIIIEPSTRDKTTFEDAMQEFYDAIERSTGKIDMKLKPRTVGKSTSPIHRRNKETFLPKQGAIFFAVCRGKVSEGLDFADDNARAVIAIGIPYPNIKDTQVKLKKQYNDKFAASRNLLTGNAWYDIQAFRALNQALGRCIRHRNDWGAIILLDERFTQDRTITNLSKWVRQQCKVHDSYIDAMTSLEQFITYRTTDNQDTPPATITTPSSSSTLHSGQSCNGSSEADPIEKEVADDQSSLKRLADSNPTSTEPVVLRYETTPISTSVKSKALFVSASCKECHQLLYKGPSFRSFDCHTVPWMQSVLKSNDVGHVIIPQSSEDLASFHFELRSIFDEPATVKEALFNPGEAAVYLPLYCQTCFTKSAGQQPACAIARCQSLTNAADWTAIANDLFVATDRFDVRLPVENVPPWLQLATQDADAFKRLKTS